MKVGSRLSFLLASIVCLSASPLAATTIIPISDRQLYSRADVVVHGIVLSSQAQLDKYGRVETLTLVRPLEVVKGSLGGDLVLHQLGGRLRDGRFFQIWGRPEYTPGYEVVVFAIARSEGDYQTAELLLGKFEVQSDERWFLFAVPDRAIGNHPGVTWQRVPPWNHSIDDDPGRSENSVGGFEANRPRELAGFLAYLRAGAQGVRASAVIAEGTLTPVVHPGVAPLQVKPEWGNINNSLYRYNNNATAVWTLQGTANITGGGAAESQGAVDAWTNDPNSTINYTLGLGSSNLIQLDALSSPCGWSTCLSGSGVIGCGGPNGGGSNTWRGDTYTTITGGTVWLRSYCTTNGFSSVTTQAVLTHELGHTLGLGHSDQNVSPHDVCTGDEGLAQMRSTVQNFTALGTDDQDAIRWIYGDGGNSCSGSTPTPTPVPPTATVTPTRTPTSVAPSPTPTPTPTSVPPTATPTRTPTSAPPTATPTRTPTPAALSVTSLAASPASPQPVGTPITWTTSTSGGTAPISFRYWKYDVVTGAQTVVRDYSTSASYSWTPTVSDVGTYRMIVWVKSNGSSAAYDAYALSAPFQITGTTPTITAVTASPASPQLAGTAVTFTASASGGIAPLQFRFWTYNSATGAQTMVRDYTTSNFWTWNTTVSNIGSYRIIVWVKNNGSSTAYDAYALSAPFQITGSAPTITSVVASPSSPQRAGTPITWTASTSGGVAPLQFRFWVYNSSTGAQTIVQNWSTSNSYTWNTTPSDVGLYAIVVWVKNAGSAADYDTYSISSTFSITP